MNCHVIVAEKDRGLKARSSLLCISSGAQVNPPGATALPPSSWLSFSTFPPIIKSYRMSELEEK